MYETLVACNTKQRIAPVSTEPFGTNKE